MVGLFHIMIVFCFIPSAITILSFFYIIQISSVSVILLLFHHQVLSDSLRPHGLQHIRLCCPSSSLRVCPNSCPLNRWCHPAISSSALFSFCFQSFPASRSFPVLFASGGQSAEALTSASALPMSIQGCFPLRLTGFYNT